MILSFNFSAKFSVIMDILAPLSYITVQGSTPPPAETASTTWTQKLASEAGINPVEYMALTEGVAIVSSRV